MDGQRQTNEREQVAAAPTLPVPAVASVDAPRRSWLPGPAWLWWVGSVVILVALVSVLTQALLAHAEARLADQARAAQTAQATPEYDANISAVAMASATDAWAFGTWGRSYNGPVETPPAPSQCQSCLLILRYDGHAWSRVPLDPALATLPLPIISVAMLSTTDGWAVGGNMVLHYTNGAWTLAKTLSHDAQTYESLTRIAMVSPTEGWALGIQSDPNAGDTPLLLHYLRGAWTPVHLAVFDQPRVDLQSISMLPTGEGWIVGGQYTDAGLRTIVLHLRGGVWTSEETGAPAQLNGVYAVSPTEAWAVGTKDIAVGPGVILHYRSGSWTSVPSPTPNLLHTVVMRSATEGWVGGDGAATLHYDGTAWTKVGLVIHGYALTSLAFAGTEGWGTGSYSGQPTTSPLLLHYADGTWSPYPLRLTLP